MATEGTVFFHQDCTLNPSLYHRTSLAVCHGATLLTLLFYVYVMHAKVEMEHPVFAIVYQEVLLLVVLQIVSFAAVLMSGIDYRKYYIPLVLQAIAMHFHQCTWLTVTYLR